jgi:isopentenyldiphosphate isomerase
MGRTTRLAAHGNPALIHRVSHVLVFNSRGQLFLQKRSAAKRIQPGRWDTSVGGHLDAGEDYLSAAVRETEEELGITAPSDSFVFLYKYLHRNEIESEYVTTYRLLRDGPVRVQKSEIDEGRFWELDEISESDKKLFTPNLLEELERYSAL